MIKLGYGRLFRQSWHPSLEELMRYVDGELGVRAKAAVRSHLRRCWACRVKREKLDHLISAFMRSQQSVLDTFPAPSPRLRERFAKRLDCLEQRSGWRAWLSRLTAGVQAALFVSRLPVKIGFSVLSVLLAVVLLVQVTSVERVSAKELLQRAEAAESRRIERVSLPVVYQRLTVRRLPAAPQAESTATWEIWHDPTHRRFSERIEDTGKARQVRDVTAHGNSAATTLSEPMAGDFPDVLRELDEVFQENRLDRQRPLSASGYQAWRGTVARTTEQVSKATLAGGVEVLKITTSNKAEDRPKRIVEAAILIRAEDWHPVQEQLKVREGAGISEYELTEAAYDVLALNTVPASIFAGLEPPRFPQPPQTAADDVETSAAPVLSVGQLKVAEMEAAYALHRLRVCLGEGVEIHQSPQGTIQVQGLVETVQRREEIAAALAGISLVRVSLRTVAEAMKDARAASDTSSEQAPERSQPDAHAALEVQSARLPLQDFLERYYSGPAATARNEPGPARAGATAQARQQIADLSKDVVSLSESASAEMWALRHLAERYPLPKAQALPPGARWLLETMVRDHLTELKSLMSRIRRLVEPVLIAFVTAHGNVPTARSSSRGATMEGSWDAGVLALFRNAEQIERLNLGLFADASLPQAQTGWATQTLLTVFATFERDVNDMEKRLAQEFTTLAKQ
ncbi:MAG: hypothetical protein L0387_11210 [Acidobacteria bacterium]|nr:hypothetical protein [Acidobacteriota bacterium]MCI0622214.1 hypothetical protein [Acidobacteriota bacterium]MCI0723146.1 hypothetical protein [Acidobacteriota bacterium]